MSINKICKIFGFRSELVGKPKDPTEHINNRAMRRKRKFNK